MFGSKQQLLESRKMWRLFNAWENTGGTAWLSTNLEDAFDWFSEAWDMARQFNPDWAKAGIDEEKIRRLQKIRRALSGVVRSDDGPGV